MLGQVVRLRLVEQLAGGWATPQELADALGLTQQNVSKHLQILHRSGIVARQPEGANLIYSLKDESMVRLLEDVVASRPTCCAAEGRTARPGSDPAGPACRSRRLLRLEAPPGAGPTPAAAPPRVRNPRRAAPSIRASRSRRAPQPRLASGYVVLYFWLAPPAKTAAAAACNEPRSFWAMSSTTARDSSSSRSACSRPRSNRVDMTRWSTSR